MDKISSTAAEQLGTVLPLELMAVQQHFIHVLILRCWGSENFAKGIVAIDEVDLPNAMRIVDLLVSSGNVESIRQHIESESDQMPVPGNTYQGILSAERYIEGRLTSALRTAEKILLTAADSALAFRWIKQPLSARDSFEMWIRSQEHDGLPGNKSQSLLSEDELCSLNHYFAHLVLTINQAMVHSFIHWHEGEKVFANVAWAASGGAMMQATAVTNLLAKRWLAPNPKYGTCLDGVSLQRIATNSEESLCFDRELASSCAHVAEEAEKALTETEFELVCRKGKEYFGEMASWRPDRPLPKIRNPCLDFERVLRSYVWEGDVADNATA